MYNREYTPERITELKPMKVRSCMTLFDAVSLDDIFE